MVSGILSMHWRRFVARRTVFRRCIPFGIFRSVVSQNDDPSVGYARYTYAPIFSPWGMTQFYDYCVPPWLILMQGYPTLPHCGSPRHVVFPYPRARLRKGSTRLRLRGYSVGQDGGFELTHELVGLLGQAQRQNGVREDAGQMRQEALVHGQHALGLDGLA